MNDSCRTFEQITDPGFVSGNAKVMESLNATILEIAPTAIPVLILGESGTGKEVYARLLHRLSDSSSAPLKKVNCAVLDPAQLLHQVQHDSHRESELLREGSLYLDNVEELDLACQRALLSVLADGENSQSAPHYFPRLICSSSRDLEADVKKGHFRKELYFRIAGVCLRLPPLRDRMEDISILLQHFLLKHALELNKPATTLTQDGLAALMAYDWPGNIRELENLARKMVALGNPELALNDLRSKPDQTEMRPPERTFSLKSAARAASRQRERELILEALERTRWNRKRAARELQISYKALLYKLKQIGSPGNESQK